MRFKAQIQNIVTFTKLAASLESLGPFAWVRLDESDVRFTVIPEQGTQVWATLSIESVFDAYVIESAANNVINLEVPLQALHRALKSANTATSASIRLTKQDGLPMLCLTINTTGMGAPSLLPSSTSASTQHNTPSQHRTHDGYNDSHHGGGGGMSIDFTNNARERETVITQHVPVRVLSTDSVDGLHEPRTKEPDVHIQFPPLSQLKAISDRFTRLAQLSRSSSSTTSAASFANTASVSASGLTSLGPRLELAANMHGCLRLRVHTDAMAIRSTWTGLVNPALDPAHVEGGEAAIASHPTTRMRALGDAAGVSERGWSTVRIDGRDWAKVMSVGRMGGRVIACFCDDHALILYVYLKTGADNVDDGSCLTCMKTPAREAACVPMQGDWTTNVRL